MLQSKKHWQVGADHDLACPRAEVGSELGLMRIGDGNANAYNCATRDTPGRAARDAAAGRSNEPQSPISRFSDGIPGGANVTCRGC